MIAIKILDEEFTAVNMRWLMKSLIEAGFVERVVYDGVERFELTAAGAIARKLCESDCVSG